MVAGAGAPPPPPPRGPPGANVIYPAPDPFEGAR